MNTVLNIPVLRTTDADFEERFDRQLLWSGEADLAIESRVSEIIADVRARRDQAVLDCNRLYETAAGSARRHPAEIDGARL